MYEVFRLKVLMLDFPSLNYKQECKENAVIYISKLFQNMHKKLEMQFLAKFSKIIEFITLSSIINIITMLPQNLSTNSI